MTKTTIFSWLMVMLQCVWPSQCTKNISQHLLGAIHLVRTYLTTDFSSPLTTFTHIYAFRVTPFCVCDFIDLIVYSPILTLLDCNSFLMLFCLRNSRSDVFVSDTHHFLVAHSVSSSLPQKIFSLMMASNCQLFYLSLSLTNLSYANAKESYSRRTNAVIVTVLTKVLSFS